MNILTKTYLKCSNNFTIDCTEEDLFREDFYPKLFFFYPYFFSTLIFLPLMFIYNFYEEYLVINI